MQLRHEADAIKSGARIVHCCGFDSIPSDLGVHFLQRNALEQFGPMVPSVLDSWSVSSCSDVGEIVFRLIDSGVFGKSETDRREDFNDVFDFEEAFVRPFLCEPGSNVAQNC
jgi:uncharacterized repeat protein (TIGR04138 family)